MLEEMRRAKSPKAWESAGPFGVGLVSPVVGGLALDPDSMNRSRAARKLLEHKNAVSLWAEEIKKTIQQGQQALGLDPALLGDVVSLIVSGAIDSTVRHTEDDDAIPRRHLLDFRRTGDRDSLADRLPSGIGSTQAIGWAIRAYGGEPYEEISADVAADAKAVEAAARMAASSVGMSLGKGPRRALDT